MKFKLWSDLHIEGCAFNYEPVPEDKETTLILAGDIGTINGGIEAFLIEQCENFRYVIYVYGNHEFYRATNMNYFRYRIKTLNDTLHNLVVLENEVFWPEQDIRILGTPLWTNFQGDAIIASRAEGAISDYMVTNVIDGYYATENHYVNRNERKLKHYDHILWNGQAVTWLKMHLENNYQGKTLIVTHWCPTTKLVQEKFKGQWLNPYFNNDLDYLFHYYNIDTWVFGHTHQVLDIGYDNEEFNGTRVITNAKGYGNEGIIGFDPYKVWEI